VRIDQALFTTAILNLAINGHADAHPSRLDRRHEWLHTDDVHHPREIVREDMQRHLGGQT
jgi:hypothetical protein